MAKDINLNSEAWCDLIFEGKNQSYGAYYLRKTSNKRHIQALIIVFVAALAIIFLPVLIKSVIPEKAQDIEVGPVSLSDLDIKEDVKEENIIEEPEAPPPPMLKETVKLTELVVTADENVKEEDMMKTQEELTETKAAISIADVAGTTDGTGVDIADLAEHKVVVAEPVKEQVHDHVEQMPEYPGGTNEFLKFVQSNVVYPVIAQEQGIHGTVRLRFVVEKDGSIGEVQIIRSVDPNCDKEAIKAVKKSPKWIPGKQNGRAVAVWFNVPVRFELQ
ncbi:MAG: energy transducer TonB [Dysgonamonadaceae bacterium]|jgi:protein TonB|nr:energy transducer TonB [Dysgonamonadaceae bacterium]